MPIITPEQEPILQRRRVSRAGWLLLAPPLLLLMLLAVVAIRPLQLGPLVLSSVLFLSTPPAWEVRALKIHPMSGPIPFADHRWYVIRGEGVLLALHLHDWKYQVWCFPGRWEP